MQANGFVKELIVELLLYTHVIVGPKSVSCKSLTKMVVKSSHDDRTVSFCSLDPSCLYMFNMFRI